MNLSFGSVMSIPASRMVRYGRDTSLQWQYDGITGPFAGGTALTEITVPTTDDMYVYGFSITSGESNGFYIRWESEGTAYTYYVDFPSDGTVTYTDFVPINEGIPANRRANSAITKVSLYVLNAGGAGVIYSGGLLIGSVKHE